jgi:hypothetical protein
VEGRRLVVQEGKVTSLRQSPIVIGSVIVNSSANKPNHPIQNPLLLVMEPRTRDNIKPLSTLYPLTKGDDTEVTLLIRNREVLGLNLDGETNYPDSLWFFLVAPGKYGTELRLGYGRLFPNPILTVS